MAKLIKGVNSIDVTHPQIAAEWDYEKNHPYTPQDFKAQSGKKVWWKCSEGHSYQAIIANRTKGSDCPFCYGRYAIPNVNSLNVLFPSIAAEWDYEKNYPYTPQDFKAQSGKKVWWKCSEGHSWQARIQDRTRGNNCPYCVGKRVIPNVNSLDVLYPDIAAEFDLSKNYPYTPQNFTAYSDRKVWWKCGEGHSWQAKIGDRTRGNNCPYCVGKRVIPNVNSLDVLRPDIAVEFDLSKNYPYTPQDFTIYSNKKVWWKCNEGHSYQAIIANRTKGSDCPFCAGIRPIPKVNTLDVLFPQLAAEFDLSKNYPYTPQDFAAHSNKSVWWRCSEGHSWKVSINNRTKDRNCPYCAGKRVIPNVNSLDVLFPSIADEWDYEKNYPYTPQDFKAQSGKMVWWKCSEGHSWRTRIQDRTRGNNCPYCSGKARKKRVNK